MKYIIWWDAGSGMEHEVVDVPRGKDPEELAYNAWKDAVVSQADYGAKEYTEEAMEDFL